MKKTHIYLAAVATVFIASAGWAQSAHELAEDLYQQGLALYRAEADIKEVIALYEQALEANPEHEGTLQELAARYNDEARFEDAEQLSLRGTGVYPEDANMYLNLGVAYSMQGKIPEALAAYEAALYLNPDFVVVLANYGAIHYEMGNTFEARQALMRAQKNIGTMGAAEKEGYAQLSEQVAEYLSKLERSEE